MENKFKDILILCIEHGIEIRIKKDNFHTGIINFIFRKDNKVLLNRILINDLRDMNDDYVLIRIKNYIEEICENE